MPLNSQDFRNRKQQMLNLLSAVERLARDRSKKQIADDLHAQAQHLEKGELNVVVCGECRRGKSSLINAFLETDGICPVDTPVTTNAVTRISYGEVEKITVFIDNGGKNKQKREISRSEILNYVTELKNSGNNQKVDLVEILLPSPKLKDGLVLYDTPGVGSLNIEHTATTYRIIPFSDAVLFVGAANEPLVVPELRFLKDISKHKPHLLHILTKKDAVSNAPEILASNLEKIAGTLEMPLERVKGVSVSSRYKLEYLDDKDPEILELSGFQNLEDEIWKLLDKGGNLLLGRAQSNALLAISQLLPPIEAEYASLAATSKEEKEALDAKLKVQEERGKNLTSGSPEWIAELNKRGKKLSSHLHMHLNEIFKEITDSAGGYLEISEYLNDIDKLAERLVVECSNGFSSVIKEADAELGTIVSDLRKMTSLKPSVSKIEAEADFSMRLMPPLPAEVTKMEKVSHFGTTVSRNMGAFAAIGGIIGGLAGSILPGAGTIAGAQLGATLGGIFGSLFGVKQGVKAVVTQDVESRKKPLLENVRKHLDKMKNEALPALDNFLTDSLDSINNSLRKEIQRSLDACSEAREALFAKRNENAAEAAKALKEKGTLIQNVYSWGKSISNLVPPEPEEISQKVTSEIMEGSHQA